MKKFALLFLALLTVLIPTVAALSTASAAPASFNDPNFQVIWQRQDQPVQVDPNAGHSWTWGPTTISNSPSTESYAGGMRVVQYYDKARMEVNNPNGDRGSLFFVTNGLLVKELISGLRQDADNTFTPFTNGSANIPVAGDPNDSTTNFSNPAGPTYASFKNVTTFNNDHTAAAAADGTAINASIDLSGTIGTISPPAPVKVVANKYDSVTQHNMVDVFVNFMNQTGEVYDNATQKLVQGPVYVNDVYRLFVFGRPISEPFWTTTKVAGTVQTVLVQMFERRVLTYTPTNPTAFQVEMGNVGQHYYKWRYVANNPNPTPTPTPIPTPIVTATNDYSQFRAPYNKSGNIPTGNTTAIDFNAASAIHTSPLVDATSNLAVFGSDTRGVFGIDITTSSQRWRYAPANVNPTPNFSGTPMLYKGVIYLGANNGRVYAINESDGTQKWISPAAGAAVTGVPATDGTNIYFASRDGVVYAFDLATGQNSQWQYNTGAEIDGGPILGADGTVYVGTNAAAGNNALYAIKNGIKVWSRTPNLANDGFLAQPALAPGGSVLYATTIKGAVYAINIADGSVKWTNPLTVAAPGYAIGTTPAISSFGLFVGSDNGSVYLLDLNNGGANATWKVTLPAGTVVRSSAAVVDGVVYFGADNGKVYGFDATDSTKQKLQATTTAAISYNSPVVNNGALYITSTDGHFYAFK